MYQTLQFNFNSFKTIEMRLFTLLSLSFIFAINSINAQSVKVYSNTGSLVFEASKTSQGTKIKNNNPTGFILAFENGYITNGLTISDIIKENKPEYTITLQPISALNEEYDSKKIIFTKFIDLSGKIPSEGSYGYFGYIPGIDLEDAKFTNAINSVMSDFGYKTIGSGASVFKEKQETPDLAIAGEITHVDKETKGTSGFKVGLMVNWSVYSVSKERVIYKLVTSGYSDSQIGHKFKDELVLALKDAVVGLITSEDFIKYANNEGRSADEKVEKFEAFVLPLVSKNNSSDYAEIVKHSINSVVTVKTEFGHGSGFLISKDGYALTNNHVIEDAEQIEVIFNSKLTLPAEIISNDKIRDVTLLKIVGGGYQPLPLDTSNEAAEIGSEVIAIGTPEDVELGQTVTKGIVSGNRTLDGKNYIQTDVSLNSGNSGGALLNADGEVIGIVVSKIVGNNIEGLGFAIPINDALDGLNIQFE